MWNNIKSTAQCILLDEYGVDTPMQCLTNIYVIFFNESTLILGKIY